MPADGPPIAVKESKTLTALLDNDKVYMYSGKWENAKFANTITQTGYDVRKGLGEIIRQKQKELNKTGMAEDLVFIIKPLGSSTYQNVITALDEVAINNIKHYAVVDVPADEKLFVEKR